jgi:hypothetical protein
MTLTETQHPAVSVEESSLCCYSIDSDDESINRPSVTPLIFGRRGYNIRRTISPTIGPTTATEETQQLELPTMTTNFQMLWNDPPIRRSARIATKKSSGNSDYFQVVEQPLSRSA